jgi:arginase
MDDTPFSVLDAPSILGLRPTGVEHLSDALRTAGLLDPLHATHAGRIPPPPYSPQRDPDTLLLNPAAIHDYSLRLAAAVGNVLADNKFPLVLGGDCSILIGCLLALKRQGQYGLFFLDGHADFYQPAASTTGEVADMDLAIVTGHGPELLTDIDRQKPLVQEADTVAFGFRDIDEFTRDGSQDVRATAIRTYPLEIIRAMSLTSALTLAVAGIGKNNFWIHLDADVLHDDDMPAVDYRLANGLHFEELTEVLKALMATGRVVGMDITIFNPSLDPTGDIAKRFVTCVVDGLT